MAKKKDTTSYVFMLAIAFYLIKIERFDAENGELVINGTINGLFYYVKNVKKDFSKSLFLFIMHMMK